MRRDSHRGPLQCRAARSDVDEVTDYFAPAPAASTPPAAWYPDPSVPGQLRWFDGTQWTGHVHPAAGPAAYGSPQWAAPQRDRSVEALLPVNRTGLSIAAGYAGLFAMLVVTAPIAIVLGVLALRDLRDKPDVGGRGRAWFGVVAGVLGSIPLLLWLT